MDRLTPIRGWPAIISIVITLTIWFIIPCPADVTPQAWHLLALFIGTIAAIIGKAMPIGAIAVVAIMLVAMTGVTNPGKPAAALNDALSGFSNQLIWLIGLSIMLSQSLLKTGLGARIGYGFIALFGKRTLGIAWALTLAETLIAPVTPSNTARGGGDTPENGVGAVDFAFSSLDGRPGAARVLIVVTDAESHQAGSGGPSTGRWAPRAGAAVVTDLRGRATVHVVGPDFGGVDAAPYYDMKGFTGSGGTGGVFVSLGSSLDLTTLPIQGTIAGTCKYTLRASPGSSIRVYLDTTYAGKALRGEVTITF